MISGIESFKTPSNGKVTITETSDCYGGVIMHLSGVEHHSAWFGVEDIKAFRKFLKKLQRQLEQAENE